ncbi:MAG: DEAD/DEAH box helicase [bacterium]
MTFQSLGLSAKILKAVDEAGYTHPTPIQEKAIPWVLKGRDILGIAQTGTGKTASFTLPMIDLLAKGRAKARMPRSLILAPTRELAAQVSENFEQYGKNHKLSMALLIGGVSFGDQERKLNRGVDVLIATPGRLLDHFERGRLMLNGVQILVIDEADRMLDMGFIPDIERICKLLPFTRQTLFFSATMPPEIQRLTDTFLHNPERVEAAPQSTAAATVIQAKVIVGKEDKRKALRRLIRDNDVRNAIIFCNRKRDVSILFRSLIKHDLSAGAIHGDLDQHVRMKVLEGFRKGEIRLLVASDVAARGLDIPNVSHIFNFDVPINAEDYIHRIGRTGRAGKEGHAFTIATRQEQRFVDAIEKLLGETIPAIELPGLEQKAGKAESAEPAETGKRKRGGRGKRKEGAESGSSRERTEKGQGRKSRRKGEKEEPVVGLGDHVPAFLLRPVRVSKQNAGGSGGKDDGDDGADGSKLKMVS